MILQIPSYKKSTIALISVLLLSTVVHAQYAAADFYYKDDNSGWESIVSANTLLSFDLEEEDSKLESRTIQKFYNNGILAESITYLNDKEEGVAKFFHPNGQLAMTGNFKNGQMNGLWKFFNQDGHLPSGDWNWYFLDSDSLKMTGQLLYGKPYGKWTFKSEIESISEYRITFE